MKVSIIGTGYVGLVTGVCLAEKGHEVVCVDIDQAKVDRIMRGEPPIHEPGLTELLQRNLGRRFSATTDLARSVIESDLTMIAVGTPFDGLRIDLSYVTQAARQIGQALADKSGYHLVVVKSTVVPGTTDDVVAAVLAEASGKTIGAEFGVGANPEFLSEGTAVVDFMQPDRIVLGGVDDRSRQTLGRLYEAFASEIPRIATTNKAAEMIKYASNSLLAALISFSNEIGNLCEALGGVDVVDVMRGVHLSQYLTPRLADGSRATAPITAFLTAGCGFGGSCLPKDVSALARHAEEHGEPMRLLSAALEINRRQPQRLIELLKRHFPSLCGVRVAVLGLAFKPDTDDIRESPALTILRHLAVEEAVIQAYDPIANAATQQALGALPVQYCGSLVEALEGADAVLVVTRWQEFEQLPEKLSGLDNPPVVVDGRRMISPTSVERYEGIGGGRNVIEPQHTQEVANA